MAIFEGQEAVAGTSSKEESYKSKVVANKTVIIEKQTANEKSEHPISEKVGIEKVAM